MSYLAKDSSQVLEMVVSIGEAKGKPEMDKGKILSTIHTYKSNIKKLS
jgi:hypothetical protein